MISKSLRNSKLKKKKTIYNLTANGKENETAGLDIINQKRI